MILQFDFPVKDGYFARLLHLMSFDDFFKLAFEEKEPSWIVSKLTFKFNLQRRSRISTYSETFSQFFDVHINCFLQGAFRLWAKLFAFNLHFFYLRAK